MAGRSSQSFQKRQKEQQRKERQEEKRAKRQQRKEDGTGGLDTSDESLLSEPTMAELLHAEMAAEAAAARNKMKS
jgi:hypothetical protein